MQKRTMMKIWIVAALVVAVVMLGACGGGSSSPAPAATAVPSTTAPTDAPAAAPTAAPATDAAALLQARCTDCHDLNRVTAARYTQEQWQQTVTRMVQKGANLTADEQTVLVAYLAATYKP
jgi:cytochrome c5